MRLPLVKQWITSKISSKLASSSQSRQSAHSPSKPIAIKQVETEESVHSEHTDSDIRDLLQKFKEDESLSWPQVRTGIENI